MWPVEGANRHRLRKRFCFRVLRRRSRRLPPQREPPCPVQGLGADLSAQGSCCAGDWQPLPPRWEAWNAPSETFPHTQLSPAPQVAFFFSFFLFFFLSFDLFRAAPAAYGGSQAKGLIRAVTAGLRQSHSNRRIRAASATYTTAQGNTGSLIH